MPNYNGHLNSNEIFSSICNMIISQQVFADNIENSFSELVDMGRVDGSQYGDTKLYYDTDILESHPWGGDAEAANLLDVDRPKDPDCQAITLDKFRQIRLTVDNYLSKRAWSTESAFASFNSVMLGWIRDTKRIYDATLYNTFIGTHETSAGKQTQTITVSTTAPAQDIAEGMANLLVDIATPGRDYNDYGNYRSFGSNNLVAVWNAKYVNKIKKVDMPTIFHKDGLVEKLGEHVLPAKYFGTVNTTGGTTAADNKTVYALVEKTYGSGSTAVHCFPGDLLPDSTAYLANETYTVDDNIMFKLFYKGSVPYMSAFEVATSFYNPRALLENHYLTFCHNTLQSLKGKPFITVRKA